MLGNWANIVGLMCKVVLPTGNCIRNTEDGSQTQNWVVVTNNARGKSEGGRLCMFHNNLQHYCTFL